MKKIQAFTIVELLVVIVIIGILSGVGISSYTHNINKARLAKARFFAGQVERQFLAEKTVKGINIFNGWYKFDNVSQTSPYIIDSSDAKNHLDYRYSSIIYESSDHTARGSGKSLKTEKTAFQKNITIPETAGNKFTIAGWFKHDGDTQYVSVLPFGLSSKASFYLVNNKTIRFSVGRNSNDKINIDTPDGFYKPSTWYYVVGSYDGDTKLMKLWIDGELVSTQNTVDEINVWGQQYIILSSLFYGWIDDVIIAPFAFDGESLK